MFGMIHVLASLLMRPFTEGAAAAKRERRLDNEAKRQAEAWVEERYGPSYQPLKTTKTTKPWLDWVFWAVVVLAVIVTVLLVEMGASR